MITLRKYIHFFLVFSSLAIVGCKREVNTLMTFSNVEQLFNDPLLQNICIKKIESGKLYSNYQFTHGQNYCIIKLRPFVVYTDNGSHTYKFDKESYEDFKLCLKRCQSKGIVASCIGYSVDFIVVKLSNFNIAELTPIDTANVYLDYKYMYISKSDINQTFMRPKGLSKPFQFDSLYLYYSR